MKNLILTLIITLPLTLWGQGWEQTYDLEINSPSGEVGLYIQETTDGNYIVIGEGLSHGEYEDTISQSEYFLFLLKINPNGNIIFINSFEGLSDGFGEIGEQTDDEGYIFTGISEESTIRLIKTNSVGEQEWTQDYENGGGTSVKQTNDGGYILIGSLSFPFDNNLFIRKLDLNGDVEWSKYYGGDTYVEGSKVQQSSDNGFVFTGMTNSSIVLGKIDENGNDIWIENYDNSTQGHDFVEVEDGYMILGGNDMVIIKTDLNGNELWRENYNNYTGYDIDLVFDNNFIICGTKEYNNTDSTELFIMKIDENGNVLWEQNYGDLTGVGFNIYQLVNGEYIVTGGKYVDGEIYKNEFMDVLIIKTDDQGNITSTFEIPLPNPNRKLEKTVNLIGQEVKPQKNIPVIEIFDDGSVEKKLIIE